MRFLLGILVGAMFLALQGLSARAQGVQMGTGLICDTQAQVEQFNAAYNGDAQATLDTINTKGEPPACGVATVAFIKGAKVGSITHQGSVYDIYEVVVVAINVGGGWIQSKPTIQYTAVESGDKGA